MDKRLCTIAAQIDDGLGVVDVGTDHGYLPLFLANNNYGGNIIASDINEAPLNTAIASAVQAGVASRISFLLCDGIKLCPSDLVDTIVIAGMGGDKICKILDETEWCMDSSYKLILQPMTKSEILRYWLCYNGFEIKREVLVDDAGTLYQIIVAVFGGETKLKDSEFFCGSYALADNQELYYKRISKLCCRFEKSIVDMSKGYSAPSYKIDLFKHILHELEELRAVYDKDS